MARTLADMTPEERQACVGMWGDIGSEPVPVVIRGVEVGMVSWVDARHPNRNGFVRVDAVTPRFDMLRAWNPDGTPPDGCWEYSSAELPLPDYSGKYTQHYRRHVTEWETTDD